MSPANNNLANSGRELEKALGGDIGDNIPEILRHWQIQYSDISNCWHRISRVCNLPRASHTWVFTTQIKLLDLLEKVLAGPGGRGRRRPATVFASCDLVTLLHHE